MKNKIIAIIIFIYLKIVHLTSFYTIRNLDKVKSTIESKAVIFALWHGSFASFLAYGSKTWSNSKVMTSLSDDGELLTQILHIFGLGTIRGDERKDGVKSLIEMNRTIKEGVNICYACDGPLGPRYFAKGGVIYSCVKTGAPIIPVWTDAKRGIVFKKAWDLFKLPFPFNRIYINFAEPIYLENNTSEEYIINNQKILSEILNDLRKEKK